MTQPLAEIVMHIARQPGSDPDKGSIPPALGAGGPLVTPTLLSFERS